MYQTQTAAVAAPRAELVAVPGSLSVESAPTPGPSPSRLATTTATVERLG